MWDCQDHTCTIIEYVKCPDSSFMWNSQRQISMLEKSYFHIAFRAVSANNKCNDRLYFFFNALYLHSNISLSCTMRELMSLLLKRQNMKECIRGHSAKLSLKTAFFFFYIFIDSFNKIQRFAFIISLSQQLRL